MVAYLLALTLAADWPTLLKTLPSAVARLEILTATADGSTIAICSGVVLDAVKGVLVTAAHCTRHLPTDGFSLTVNGRHATVVKENRILDLAVVSFDVKHETAMPLADLPPVAGDEIALVGFSFGDRQLSVHFGHVSLPQDDEGSQRLDVMVIPGQSGGAAINARGEFVGLIQAVQFTAGGASHVALTAPLEAVRSFVKEYLPKK